MAEAITSKSNPWLWASLTIGTTAFFLGIAFGAVTINLVTNEEVKFFKVRYEHYKAQAEYFFEGANKRQYVDICTNKAGEEGIYYKDECLPKAGIVD